MKNHPFVLRVSHFTSRGFALVATLMLMMLLALLAIGMLSLSTVSMRSLGKQSAQAEARANARMALMIAVGELQRHMGPDQRISANSAIIDESPVTHRHWLGVWDSWKAGEGETSQHQTIQGESDGGMSATYEKNREDYFRGWLVSLDSAERLSISAPQNVSLDAVPLPTGEDSAVRLVGEGSLGLEADKAADYVAARLISISDPNGGGGGRVSGRYGWWVSDELQKARVMADSYAGETNLAVANRIFRQQAPGSAGNKMMTGLENLADEMQLDRIASLATIDLLDGANGRPAHENFFHLTPFSNHVLSDVREGGLKRDLSALLERAIDPSERGNEFMLYKFNTKENWLSNGDLQEAVPIQDLAAFYQLYDSNRSGWRMGLKYSSNLLAEGMQIVSPDYGSQVDDPAYYREYTNIYRQPIPVKIQFLLSLMAEENPDAPETPGPDDDTHLLRFGITPAVTLWNPTNVPMVMNFDAANPDFHAISMRLGPTPLRLRVIKEGAAGIDYTSDWRNLVDYRGNPEQNTHIEFINLYFSGVRPIRLEPGEVKAFSLKFNERDQRGMGGRALLKKTERYYEPVEVHEGWNPESFLYLFHSAFGGNDPAIHTRNQRLLFSSTDQIRIEIDANNTAFATANGNQNGAFFGYFTQSNYRDPRYATNGWQQRHYEIYSRQHGNATTHQAFNRTLLTKGFPGQAETILLAGRSGQNLITRNQQDEGWPFMQFSLMAGVETRESAGFGSGRKFASRPFLHSSPLTSPTIDGHDGMSLYNVGWNWSVNEINEIFEAPVQTNATNQGYYGGGYTPDFGTTNVVQQEIPVVPPISIGALSHARLGGFTLATNTAWKPSSAIEAVGLNGLFPQSVQSIGNSYAHPQLAADLAFKQIVRPYVANRNQPIIFADHSYLANKALWDEFFFSSISRQPASVRAYENERSLSDVATQFFFDNEPLPNRRIKPYKKNLDEGNLGDLLGQYAVFSDGFADKIAAHLMVEGGFNINSTSVEAWKALLASLRSKPVAYLDKDKALAGVMVPDEATPTGTPVGSVSMPNAVPGGGTDDPQDPQQWLGWRELNDEEITELAEAIVRQVKRRGPFLSLSEFVNRRLDRGNPELSVKGALQAALDDPAVSINAGFRVGAREFTAAEKSSVAADFPEALEGPIAYGSAAYVDQSDLLRNFAAQLTPRGDTFMIRTYGDSLDAKGKVVARAWCEAVVQRVPEYLDGSDEAHLKQAELTSPANRNFGRKIEIVNFRWLNPSEI